MEEDINASLETMDEDLQIVQEDGDVTDDSFSREVWLPEKLELKNGDKIGGTLFSSLST
jgi:hypothetical protein